MSVRVPIVVDYDPKAMRQATGDLSNLDKQSQKSFMGLKGSALSASIGIASVTAAAGLAVKGLSSAIKAAQESETSNARLRQALDATNISYDQHSDAIEQAIQKTSKLAAVDDEELQDAFSNMVRKTGDVTRSLEGMQLAAEIARGRNVDLAVASKAVEQAMSGKSAALRKLTGTLPEYTGNMDAAKAKIEAMKEAAGGKLTPALKEQAEALKDAAKEADKNANMVSVLEAAQKKFAGSAEAYGQTAKGAQERLGVAFENLQEKIGEKLLPVMAKLANKAVELLSWLEANWPKIERVITPVINVIVNVFKNLYDTIQIVIAVFRGDWAKAWDLAVGIVRRTITGLVDLFKPLLKVGELLGRALLDGMVSVLSKLGDILRNIFVDALNGLIGLIESSINKIIGAYNSTVGKLASIVGVPNIPSLAIPRIPEAAGGGARTTQSLTVNVTAGMGADGAAIGDAIVNSLIEWQRRNGTVPVTTR